MSVWQVSFTAIVKFCTDCEPQKRGDILADSSKIMASHQDIPKLRCTQIMKQCRYSIKNCTAHKTRCPARNTNLSIVCSSEQHLSDSPKSVQFPRQLPGWRHFLPHSNVPAQEHSTVPTGAFQSSPAENQWSHLSLTLLIALLERWSICRFRTPYATSSSTKS